MVRPRAPRRLFTALAILALVVTFAGIAPPAMGQAPDFAGVDEAARDAVQSGEIPGVVVLVGRGNEILLHRSYGSRRLVPDMAPMTVDTIFDIASLTKPLGTTLAVMSLVERGTLKLDAPVGRYLPEFRTKPFANVTIQRLLTHTGGFPAIPPTGAVTGSHSATLRALAKLPFDYSPGSGTQYSDVGFIILGEVVARVSGMPLDRYLDKILFKPLGLKDTTFNPGPGLRPRIAPTEWASGHILVGEVHDPRARALGGVAGHAGIFSTAADVGRICRMLVDGGTLDGRQVLKPATIKMMWTRTTDGSGSRALGWDVSSAFARSMMPFFPPDSMIHTGFTGTSVMIDPVTGVYLVVLSNRVHPSGGGAAKVRELRVRVAAAVGATMFATAGPPPPAGESVSPAADGPPDAPAATGEPAGTFVPPSPAPATPSAPVLSGLDVLVRQNFAPFAGYSVGLVTNHTGVDVRGRRNIDLLFGAPGVRLAAIFTPEHGLGGLSDTDVPHGRDVATGVTIWSLYGTARRPTPEMLRGITLLVFDVQDVGARYYTYLTTLMYVMEEAAKARIPVVVLDRPNPITGRYVEGPLLDLDLASFTAPHTIPVRTGMTIGEFGKMVAAERKINASLTVVPLEGWDRGRWFDGTGLPWVNPSPNIRSVTQALLYSGVGLLEATNLSVGRGTDSPFEVIGAPWIEPYGVVGALNAQGLAGVRFEPVVFTPTGDRYANTQCFGVRLIVTDREAIRPVTVGLAVGRTLRERHREQFRAEGIQNLLVNRSTMWAFLRGESLPRVMAWAEMARTSFLSRRASYLIY